LIVRSAAKIATTPTTLRRQLLSVDGRTQSGWRRKRRFSFFLSHFSPFLRKMISTQPPSLHQPEKSQKITDRSLRKMPKRRKIDVRRSLVSHRPTWNFALACNVLLP